MSLSSSSSLFRVSCLQFRSSPDFHLNFEIFTKLATEAAQRGAKILFTPENTFLMRDKTIQTPIYTESNHPILPRYIELAKKLGIFINLGSLAVLDEKKTNFSSTISSTPPKLKNRSYMISPFDGIISRYDKIHLFDVPNLSEKENYLESEKISPGNVGIICDIQQKIEKNQNNNDNNNSLSTTIEGRLLPRIGLSICYDLRFPSLYRDLSQRGAEILSIPAAFTVQTGILHWEILLRSRAIENRCFVVAAAQCGEHEGGRKSYGNSMIIDYDGKILAHAGTEENCLIFADLDIDKMHRERNKIPSWSVKENISIEIQGNPDKNSNQSDSDNLSQNKLSSL